MILAINQFFLVGLYIMQIFIKCFTLLGCTPQMYKWETGNSHCLNCPRYSEAPDPGAAECTCVAGYFRGPSEEKDRPCTRM